jgi:hypothetical protein
LEFWIEVPPLPQKADEFFNLLYNTKDYPASRREGLSIAFEKENYFLPKRSRVDSNATINQFFPPEGRAYR